RGHEPADLGLMPGVEHGREVVRIRRFDEHPRMRLRELQPRSRRADFLAATTAPAGSRALQSAPRRRTGRQIGHRTAWPAESGRETPGSKARPAFAPTPIAERQNL